MKKKVLIIGNGFDLDLGWKTRYSDFARSECWPFNEDVKQYYLDYFLNQKKEINNWFDIEDALFQYADTRQRGIDFHIQKDVVDANKITFNSLTESLTKYLSNEQTKPIEKESYAAKVLKSVIDNGYFSSIYTFNYTNLALVAKQLGKEMPNFEYVHGSIERNDIILGVSDQLDVVSGYSFLYKTFNRNYSSHHILFDLKEAEEIVFFGHSLSSNDYHYFEEFFKLQSSETLARENGKRITIFTYDDNSRLQIMEQLRFMNDKRTNLLFGMNDLNVIHTKDRSDDNKLDAFLKHLKEDSSEAHRTKLYVLR